MRVGVVVGMVQPSAGGAWTFQNSLIKALGSIQSEHTFIPLDCAPAGRASPAEHWKALRETETLPPTRPDTWLGRLGRDIRQRFASLPRKVVRRLSGRHHSQDTWLAHLEESIRAREIDIAWFMTPPGLVLSVPFMTTVWDLEHRKRPYFPEVSVTGWNWAAREQAYRCTLPRAAFVLTGTHAGKNEIVRFYGVPPDNVKVVPFPAPEWPNEATEVQSDNIRKTHGIRGDFVLYPAQFWPHKNHVNLLRALALLNRKYGLELEMVFTGSDKGNLRHVQVTIDELGLSDQVHILGFVPREDLSACYRSAVALTFASYFGPDNIPPLEAFAHGCPVLAARVAGAEEQLGEAALLFDPGDPEGIAAAVLAVHRDRELRARLVRKGAEIASARTPQAYITKVCEIIDGFAAVRRCWGRQYDHS